MGDRHGGRFARRGRALSPTRPQVDAHRGVGLRWRATVFRCRGVVGRICPRARTLSSAKASRHGARAKGFAPRRNAPLGEGLPTRRTGERICPRRNAPHGEGLPTRRTSERICPRRNTPLGEGLPTRRTGERICLAQEHSPRRRPTDTAHERKVCPAGFALAPRADERRAALDRRTAGKTPLRRGRTRDGAAAAEFIHRKK